MVQTELETGLVLSLMTCFTLHQSWQVISQRESLCTAKVCTRWSQLNHVLAWSGIMALSFALTFCCREILCDLDLGFVALQIKVSLASPFD